MKLVNKNLVANLLEALNFNKRHFNVDPIPILHRDYHLYHFPQLKADILSLYSNVIAKLPKDKRQDPYLVAEDLLLRNKLFFKLAQKAINNFIEQFDREINKERNHGLVWKRYEEGQYNQLSEVTIQFALDTRENNVEELSQAYLKENGYASDIFLSDVKYSTSQKEKTDGGKMTVKERKTKKKEEEKSLDFQLEYESLHERK